MKGKKTFKPRKIQITQNKLKIYTNKDKYIDVKADKHQRNAALGKLIHMNYIESSQLIKEGESPTIIPKRIELTPWDEIISIKMGEKLGDSVKILLKPSTYKNLEKELEDRGLVTDQEDR